MDVIDVKFFGIPSVTIDSSSVEFPFTKAESIFYLLIYEKTISREVLSNLLWGDMDEQSAKKNLRNAIYIIRKNTFDDIILSPKRSILQINEKYKIISDVDYINHFNPCNINKDFDINRFLDIYDGQFMEELKLKSNYEFTQWIDENGLKMNTTYMDKLKKLSHKLLNDKEYNLSEMCCQKLIKLEEYDEYGYTNLMNIYLNQNRHQEAIDIYNNLAEKLNRDLSVKTSRETEEVYEEIIKSIKMRSDSKPVSFYGRENEKKILYNNIYNFIGNKGFKSFIISGEDGIGKSLLLDNIINDFDLNILLIRINCYEYETDFIFKFWDKVFQQISDLLKEKNLKIPRKLINIISKFFPTLDIYINEEVDNSYNISNYDLAEKAVFDLFGILSSKLKIIFIVDNLNNADKASLELLYKTILANRYKIMLIATKRDEIGKSDDRFYYSLKYNNIIENIRLNRFNKEETKGFVDQIMPEAMSKIERIFSESEGNPLFIVEILNNIKNGNSDNHMTNKIENLIQARLVGLSQDENKLLSICSLFQDIFYIEMLSKITDIGGMKLIDIVDELITKEILKEELGLNGKVGLVFTHRKIREYVYKSISSSKRIILHSKIGEYYEDELLKNNRFSRILYPEIIYHFSSSNNKCKLFKYKIRWLEEILNFKHEIFPITENENSFGSIEYYLDEDSLEKEFSDLKELYKHLNCDNCKTCAEEKTLYLYLQGRFNKNRGNIQEGVNLLNKMINISDEYKYYEYGYNGYLQLAHYYVNVNDVYSMGKSIDKAEEISNVLNDKCKIAIVWRLKGYCYILSGEYQEGENYIDKALEIFNLDQNRERYRLNIVASMFYLGESYRLQSLFKNALEYYNKAIDLCCDNEDCPAAALIFSKVGYVKYKLGVIDEALFYYLKSLKAYEKNIFAWGRTEVYYYLYKLYESKNMMKKANLYLENSLKYIDKYTSEELKNKIYELINRQKLS